MKSRPIASLAAVAFAVFALVPLGHAAKVTPTQFRMELGDVLGNRKNAAAYNKAGRYFQKVLGDKRNKKFAQKYAKLLTKAMRGGRVKIALLGKATNTFTKALLAGYFKKKAFNLYDRTYNKAFTVLVKALPLSKKTVATSQALYNSIKTFAARKGVSQDQVFAYYTSIDSQNRLPEPVS
jgi:hypothetical protein